MSEASRHRRLFLENTLEELRSRHGEPEDWPMPAWLDSLEGFQATARTTGDFGVLGNALVYGPGRAPSPSQPADMAEEPLPPGRMLQPAEALQKLDRYGETPLFECPVCGDDLAKANVRIDLWHCTACQTSGRASRLAPTHVLPSRPAQRV